MIKTCPKCNAAPSQDGFIKCSNDKCEEFNIEYLPHEWQQLPRGEVAEIELLNHQDKHYFESVEL